MEGLIPEDYARFGERVLADFQDQTTVTHASDVAETVWRAANDTTGQLRFPAGPDAVALAQSIADRQPRSSPPETEPGTPRRLTSHCPSTERGRHPPQAGPRSPGS